MALDGLDEVLAGKLGCPQQFSSAEDSVSCISENYGVVDYERDSETVERVPPLASVFSVVVQKAHETIGATQDVYQLEEVGENLAEFLTSSSVGEPVMAGMSVVALVNRVFASSGVAMVVWGRGRGSACARSNQFEE